LMKFNMTKVCERAMHPLRVALNSGLFVLLCLVALLPSSPVFALDPIMITSGEKVIDISSRGVFYEGRGDRLQVETAAGPDGIAGRMAVRARTTGSDPRWVVFALSNQSNETIERWLTAERYSLNGSQFFQPDLDKGRIALVTPSIGFTPERIVSDKTDIFRLSLEPGATVTFVAELLGDTYPRLSLWQVEAFEKKRRDGNLFDGILLGITGIMAILLTALFAANHKAMFPAGALVIWTGLAYMCVEFGFWHKLFNLSAGGNADYRAASEAAFATSLVIFLYIFLSLRLWHGWVKLFFISWILAQGSLVVLAFFDAPLAASLARLSFGAIGVMGSLIVLYLAIRGQSRALSLIPTWFLFLVWLFGMGVTILGLLSGDSVITAMNAGLVLLLALFGFTVTHFAFQGLDHMGTGPAERFYFNGQAIEGAGACVWFWDARHDTIEIGKEVEESLGLSWGTLSGSFENFLDYLHPTDKERFSLMLLGVKEQNGGPIGIEFRMRRSDGTYLWYDLKAHTDDWVKARSLTCVGLLQDITSSKRAHERLLHDAVHDSLTGLPNRELYFDRLATAVTRVEQERAIPPAVLFVDLDRFKNINTRFGMGVGDTMLLTVARRLVRYLRPQDALARVGGDQFAILLAADTDPHHVAQLAERVRKALRGPVKIAGEDVILTSSIGCSVYSGIRCTAEGLFREAEIAMFRAKRMGTDRIEMFKPEMLSDRDDRVALESDLRQAISRGQLEILYQPIMRLARSELVGFEALLRWEHPKFGPINPTEFIAIAEENGTISELGAFVLDHASKEAALWQRIVPMNDKPLYVSVNVSSGQLFREELVVDIRHILSRQSLPQGALRLEITESIVMENPEQAIDILNTLKALGAGLSMDDFGTGYSSLSYLLRFPFDTIKVDREIVQHRNNEEAGAVILRSIVALAHELSKDVVAEGIETDEDAAYLRSIRCDYGQGFYYGEPMESGEVLNLLTALVKSGKLVLKPTVKKAKKAPLPPSDINTVTTARQNLASAPAPHVPKPPSLVKRVAEKAPISPPRPGGMPTPPRPGSLPTPVRPKVPRGMGPKGSQVSKRR
jgi:diguanylate cyclase (GGDEF)-like protein/PAS domain S-box-containing protein